MKNELETIKTSTYRILSSYWDTSIAMCCLFASFVLSFSIFISSQMQWVNLLLLSPYL